jgi:glutamate/aspartate transport system substrate-binding protein
LIQYLTGFVNLGRNMNRSPKASFRLLLAVCLAVVAACAAAAEPSGETLKAIKARNAVVVGYLDAFPMSFVGKDGQPGGYSIDICRAIAEDAAKAAGLESVKIRFVQLTLEERFDAVANGKVDIECGTSTITLARMRKVDFTNTVFLDGGSFLVRRGSAISSIPALVDETIAVIPGTTTEKALRDTLAKRYINAKVIEVRSHGEGMAALAEGTATAYASDRVLLVGLLLETRNLQNFTMVPDQFSYEPYGFAVRRNDADFRLVANSTLARLSSSGKIYEIFERWFSAIGKPSPGLATMYLINALPE